MASPLFVILLGTIELAVGVGIGWFLARPEHSGGEVHPSKFRGVLESLQNTLVSLQNLSLNTVKIAENLGELRTLVSLPERDADREGNSFIYGVELTEQLQSDLDRIAERIRMKLEELESRLASHVDVRFGNGTPNEEAGESRGAAHSDFADQQPEEAHEVPESVVEIIEQLKESRDDESERRTAPRFQATFPVVVLPLNEKLQPAGRHFQAVTRDISTVGISYFHSSPAISRLLLVELFSHPVHPKRVLVETERCEQFGSVYITYGRFIAQVPPNLAMNAAVGDTG